MRALLQNGPTVWFGKPPVALSQPMPRLATRRRTLPHPRRLLQPRTRPPSRPRLLPCHRLLTRPFTRPLTRPHTLRRRQLRRQLPRLQPHAFPALSDVELTACRRLLEKHAATVLWADTAVGTTKRRASSVGSARSRPTDRPSALSAPWASSMRAMKTRIAKIADVANTRIGQVRPLVVIALPANSRTCGLTTCVTSVPLESGPAAALAWRSARKSLHRSPRTIPRPLPPHLPPIRRHLVVTAQPYGDRKSTNAGANTASCRTARASFSQANQARIH